MTTLRSRLVAVLARMSASLRSGARRARQRVRQVRSRAVLDPEVHSLSWRPRDVAERLARRAHRTDGRHRAGSPSGGRAVLARYGSRFYGAIGALGGRVVLEERGIEYMQDLGARGGATTRQRYGPEHYAEIGRKGGLAGRGRRRLRKRPGQLELPLEAS